LQLTRVEQKIFVRGRGGEGSLFLELWRLIRGRDSGKAKEGLVHLVRCGHSWVKKGGGSSPLFQAAGSGVKRWGPERGLWSSDRKNVTIVWKEEAGRMQAGMERWGSHSGKRWGLQQPRNPTGRGVGRLSIGRRKYYSNVWCGRGGVVS